MILTALVFLEPTGQGALRSSNLLCSLGHTCDVFGFAVEGETTLVADDEVQLQHGLLKPLQVLMELDAELAEKAMPVIEPSK
jgi:hypothetical protein